MTGSHHWYDPRTAAPTRAPHDPYRAYDRDGNLVVELAEVGRMTGGEPTRGERSETVTSSGETQPVGAVGPQYRTAESGPTSGLGPRVEKILLVAEQEAAETRRSATRESTAMIERARDEADVLRQEGEQAVRARRAEIERLADRRAAELDERERRLEREREDARTERERVLDDAREEADRLLAEAVELAEAVRAEADEELAGRRADLDRELADRRAEVARQMGWLEESRRAARDLARMLLEQVGDRTPDEQDDDGAPAAIGGPAVAGPATVARAAATVDEGPDDVRGAVDEGGHEAPADLDPATRADLDPATQAVDEVAAPGRVPRHSACIAPPPELRFVGSFGLPLLEPVGPDEDDDPVPAPGVATPDWFTETDTTERLHTLRASRPTGRTA